MRRLWLLLGWCLAVALALPATAGAATTVGSDLVGDPNQGKGAGTFLMPMVRSGSAGASISNVDGVIVKWRLRYLKNNASSGGIALRVGSRDGPKFRGGATSAPVNPPAATDMTAIPTTTEFFPTRIPIFQGNFIGVDLISDAAQRLIFRNDAGSGAALAEFVPRLAENESRDQSFAAPDTEVLVQAVVEPDPDGDGFGNETQDNCPGAPNPDQADTDGDGTADGCDADDDNDGVSDLDEAARGTNPLSSDSDGDGRTDPTDNCATLANLDQADTDGDGAGDACDSDDDNDGTPDATDAFPLDAKRSVLPPAFTGPLKLGTITPDRRGRVTLKGVGVACPAQSPVACVVKTKIGSFGRATQKVKPGRSGKVRVKLSRSGRAKLRRRGSVRTSAVMNAASEPASKAKRTVRFRLRSRR